MLATRPATIQEGQPWPGLWVVAAFQCALLLINIGRDSLWLDEMTSLAVVTGSLEQAVRFFEVFPEQHPLYYVVLRAWMTLGENEFVLRSLSAVFTVLTTLQIYWLAREFMGEREARIAVSICAFSPFLLYYGQEGRMYSMLMLLALLATHLYMRWMRAPSARLAALYWLVSVAAVYTHLFAVFVVASHTFWVAISPRQRHRLLSAFLLAGSVALAYVPWMLFIYLHPSDPQNWKSMSYVVLGIPYTIVRWTVGYSVVLANAGWKSQVPTLLRAEAPIIICAAIGFGWAALQGLQRFFRDWQTEFGLILSLLFVPALMAVAVSPVAILVSERYLIVSYPAYALVLAAGLSRLSASPRLFVRVVAPVLIVATTVVALSRYYWDPRFGKAQWREVAQLVAKEKTAADAVLLHKSAIRTVFQHYAPDVPVMVTIPDGSEAALLRDTARIWFVVSHADDEGKPTLDKLALSHVVVRDTLFARDAGIHLYLLQRR